MRHLAEVAVDNKKNCNTYAEIRKRIKEFFKTKGKTLTEEELDRAVRAYIYLIDDCIPVSAALYF